MSEAALLDYRRRKDEHFAAGKGPLRGEALQGFSGLSYYPPDPAWRLRLPLEATGDEVPRTASLTLNTGEQREMDLAGRLTLPLPTGPVSLLVYQQPGEERPARLFIPFRDATSGHETYGAGRYLDAPVTWEEGVAWVTADFNLAYHPYCAYGEGWACPLPPAQNVFSLPVRAGERLPLT